MMHPSRIAAAFFFSIVVVLPLPAASPAPQRKPLQVEPVRSAAAAEVDGKKYALIRHRRHSGRHRLHGRLEPVFMQTGKAADWAATLSKKHRATTGKLNAELMVKTLVENRHFVSFFNDVDVTAGDPRIPAAQYFGTKGFFASYDARLDAPLTEAVKAVWQDGFEKLQSSTLNPMQLAKTVLAAEAQKSPPQGKSRGEFLLRLWRQQ